MSFLNFFINNYNIKNNNRGQSVLEIIIAMAIFVLIASSMISLVLGGNTALEQGGEQTQAEYLAQEAIEAIRSIRDGAWNEIIYNQSAVATSNHKWVFSGEGTDETIGQYTRTITFEDVCRDNLNNIATCPASYTDIYTKKISVVIEWTVRQGITNSVEQTTYLTNWDSIDWLQTNWSGGAGQYIWSDITKYYSDDNNIDYSTNGEIKLISNTGGCGTKIWPFTTASNYNYDTNDIEVTNGVAQLISTGTTTINTFRVTEYYLAPGTFNNTTYNLSLNQDLSDNYFVIISGSDGNGSKNNNRGPDEDYIILSADPNGTGDLDFSGAKNILSFSRQDSVNSWSGVITVTECLANCDTSGFKLLDAQRVVHSNGNTSGSDSSVAWHDINQVMLLGGFNGSGCTTSDSNNSNHDLCHVKIWPSGSNTINWERHNGSNNATSLVMTLEWGSEWTVQRVNVTGTAGGNGANSSSEYDTASINPVARSHTWVWGTGYTTDNGIGDGAEGSLITLGNGVTQKLLESTVAVGQEYNDNKNFEVYALTHPDLQVDYHFKIDGNSNDINFDMSTDNVTATTSRMAIVYNGCNGTGTAYPRPILSARYLNDNTIRLSRRRSGQPFPAWVEAMDFSGIINNVTTYSTDESAINPFDSYNVTNIDSWTSFTETANKNSNTEIYYQLSADGSIWQYWNGNNWATAGNNDYNTADIINNHINTFATSSAQINFKAFLSSDGINQVQLDDVSIGCQQIHNWPFTTASNYNYDTNDIEVTNGVAQLIANGGGDIIGIEDNITDSYEFDTNNGVSPDFIHIANDIYAIAYTGPGNDGWLKTVEIDSNGNIGSIIDTLEYDTSYGGLPNIININNDIYAIAYTGPGNDGWLKTVSIDTDGTIANSPLDSLEFDTSNALYADIININNDIYAIAYTGPGNDGWLKTVEIDSNGQITNNVIDAWEYDTNNGREPSTIKIATNILAVVSRGPGNDGFIDTIEIDSNGNITKLIIDTLEYDTSYGGLPNIININNDIYAIAYTGPGNDGWLKTVEINTNGQITNNVIDSLEFDISSGKYAEILYVTDNKYLVVYSGPGNDGYVKLINIDTNGNIGSIVDTLEFDTSSGYFPNIINVGGNFYTIAYQGPGSDGWLKTIELTISSPSYSDTNPTINPNSVYSGSNINQWTSFTETANKNSNTEIYYQLSTDGSTWQYWNGNSWTTAGNNDYNTADIIDSNINTFATSSAQISFKAFLSSDGSDQVQLDEISIGWGERGGGTGYATFGYLISSAYNMSDNSPIQGISWTEDLPINSDIKFQVRSAPDSSGSPGTWTSWYGALGAGSYYSNAVGTLISTDLNNNQWVQYRVELSGDGSTSPILKEIKINYK